MVYKYTAVFRKDQNSNKFYVWVPDITGCKATGAGFYDAFLQIVDALIGFLLVYEDDNLPIPEPNSAIDIDRQEDDLLWPITIDTNSARYMLERDDIPSIWTWKQKMFKQYNSSDDKTFTEDDWER